MTDQAPAFDPSQPFEHEGAPPFDPSQPFSHEAQAQPQTEQSAKPISAMDRFEHGLWQPVEGATQTLVHILPESVVNAGNKIGSAIGLQPMTAADVDKQAEEQEGAYQAGRKAAGEKGIDWIETAGNAVLPALAAPAVEGMGAATALGAATGAASPVTEGDHYWGEKAKQTAAGAATGPLSIWTSRLIQPQVNKALDFLIQRGVNPTLGQVAGGLPKAIEERLSGLPIIGDLIKSAQNRAIREFNQAGYNAALAPIGEAAEEPAGHAGVAEVEQKLGDAYNKLLPNMTFKADRAFNGNLQNLRNLAAGMPIPQAQRFETILQNTLGARIDPVTNGMDGQTLKGVESELGYQAKGYLKDPSFDNRQLGSAIQEVQALVRNALQRQNPAQAKELAAINQGWAAYARLRDAASRVGTEEGVFTPAQLQRAVRAGDQTVGKGATAKGTAMLQDLAEAAKSVLGNKIPDSGTAGRYALWQAMAPALGLGAVGTGSYELSKVNPGAGAALGLLGAAYTPAGQKIIARALTQRPGLIGAVARPAAATMRNLGPIIGTELANHYIEQPQ